jgi:hypothetical protein
LTARIPTSIIDARLKPLPFLQDRRVQAQLSPEHFRAYINLLCHVVALNAENDAKYTDGEFDCAIATGGMVPHVTGEALAEMIAVGLVDALDRDRMKVLEFLPDDGGYQSSHAELMEQAEKRLKDRDRKRVERGTKPPLPKPVDDPTVDLLTEHYDAEDDAHICDAPDCQFIAVVGSNFCIPHREEFARCVTP